MYKGILYVASNEIIQEAIISARQIRKQMDNPNITVITDELKSENDCFDKVIVEENFHSDWRVKPEKIPDSPYDRTIYLDSDTYVTEDISDMYNILNEFDIAVSREPMGITRTVDELPRAFPEFNTGIMLFENNENTRSLFDTWRKIYQDRQERMDQPSFRKALYESDVAFTSLPPEYNCRWSVAGMVSDELKIFVRV